MWLDVSAAVPDVARLQEALVSVGKVAIMDGSIYMVVMGNDFTVKYWLFASKTTRRT